MLAIAVDQPRTVQNFRYHGREVQIDVARVPEISKKAMDIFDTIGIQLPLLLEDSQHLVKQIHAMEQVEEMRITSQASSCCRKTTGVAQTTGSIGLIVGTASAFVIGGPFGIGFGVAGTLLHTALSNYLWNRGLKTIHTIEKNYPGKTLASCFQCCSTHDDQDCSWSDIIIAAIGPGTMLPAYEALTQKDRLKKVQAKQRIALADMFDRYQRTAEERLPGIYHFFTTEFGTALNILNGKIAEVAQYLLNLQRLSVRSGSGEAALERSIQDLHQAKTELEQAGKFYLGLGLDWVVVEE